MSSAPDNSNNNGSSGGGGGGGDGGDGADGRGDGGRSAGGDPTAELLQRTKARSSALRRKKRHLSFGGGGLLVAALVVSLVIALGGSTSTSPGPSFALQSGLHVTATLGSAEEVSAGVEGAVPTLGTAEESQVAAGEQAFSFRLLSQLLSSGGSTSNEVVSPISLATALSMLDLGSRGETGSQISAALGVTGLSTSRLADGWAALDADLQKGANGGGVALDEADSLWAQEGLQLDPAFMDDLGRSFDSGLWEVNFAKDTSGAIQSINGWASQATHGLIPALFSPQSITDQTALVLANAVYFKAAWTQKFSPNTEPGPFHLPSGQTTQVPFMDPPDLQQLSVPWVENRSVDAVELPYTDGRFAALVIMPKSGTLTQYLRTLDPTSLDSILGELSPSAIELSLPSFEIGSDDSLASTLQQMGIVQAFSPSADLSGISPTPLMVQAVVQDALLHVTPDGTEAAAATGISVEPGAARQPPSAQMTIDHPFLFLIRDTQTGAILFASAISDPTGGAAAS